MKLLVSLALLSLFSFNLAFSSEPQANPYDQEDLTIKLEQFKSLVERNLSWRAKTTILMERLNKRALEDKPFKAKDIRELSEYTIPEYQLIQVKLKSLISSTNWMVHKKTIIKFSNETTEVKKICSPNVFAPLCRFFDKYISATLNPYDEKGTFYFLHGLNSLAASSLLTDNYLLIFSQLQSNKKVREIIRYEISGFKDFLSDLNKDFSTIKNYVSFSNSADLFEKFRKFYNLSFRENLFETKEFAYLYTIIKNSYSLKEITKDGSYDRFKDSSREVRRQFFSDKLKRIRDVAAYQLSKAFGNTAGSVRTRKGKLLNISKNKLMEIQSSLKPLDILFEKTPFALTDKFIPGHFGHVAIWIGSKEELVELGVWNHPIVRPHHTAIEAGRSIIEALRPGVQINSLKDFMNIDDFAVVRLKENMSTEDIRDSVIRTFKQIGKDYDFNFDVETRTRIICSELAYVSYEEIDWFTYETVGRYTISPENVGQLATDIGQFRTTILFHKGKQVLNDVESYFSALIKKDYENLPSLY